MVKFRDTDKKIEIKGDLLKMITNRNYNVDPASLSDKKLMCDFTKEMYFDLKAPGNKNPRDGSLIRLPKSSAVMASDFQQNFCHLILTNYVID